MRDVDQLFEDMQLPAPGTDNITNYCKEAVVQVLESVMGGGPGDGTQRVLVPEVIRGATLVRASVE